MRLLAAARDIVIELVDIALLHIRVSASAGAFYQDKLMPLFLPIRKAIWFAVIQLNDMGRGVSCDAACVLTHTDRDIILGEHVLRIEL